jgi:cyclopropane fatty-acyl-phospholipid synthase-like methyltransferase
MKKMAASIWDAWNEQGGPKYPHEKVVQFCFRNYPQDQRGNVQALDLGCGTGVHVVFLTTEGFRTTGVDISEVGIAKAKKKLSAFGLEAAFCTAGVDEIDFPHSSFNLVICVGVYDCTGPAVAKTSVGKLLDVLSLGARGLFVFASDRDFRVNTENPLGLHGYKRGEVEEIFSCGFARVWIDRYVTTYQGGTSEQNDWLVTIQR